MLSVDFRLETEDNPFLIFHRRTPVQYRIVDDRFLASTTSDHNLESAIIKMSSARALRVRLFQRSHPGRDGQRKCCSGRSKSRIMFFVHSRSLQGGSTEEQEKGRSE